jgi:hypothetical protein
MHTAGRSTPADLHATARRSGGARSRCPFDFNVGKIKRPSTQIEGEFSNTPPLSLSLFCAQNTAANIIMSISSAQFCLSIQKLFRIAPLFFQREAETQVCRNKRVLMILELIKPCQSSSHRWGANGVDGFLLCQHRNLLRSWRWSAARKWR